MGGRLALTIEAVQRFSEAGDPVVLVRDEASTADIGSLAICRGFVTATGARTAHAVVVARQLGLACVVGCGGLSVDIAHGRIQLGDTVLREGDRITVDGANGLVYSGDLAVIEERPDDLIRRVEEWRAAPTG